MYKDSALSEYHILAVLISSGGGKVIITVLKVKFLTSVLRKIMFHDMIRLATQVSQTLP